MSLTGLKQRLNPGVTQRVILINITLFNGRRRGMKKSAKVIPLASTVDFVKLVFAFAVPIVSANIILIDLEGSLIRH